MRKKRRTRRVCQTVSGREALLRWRRRWCSCWWCCTIEQPNGPVDAHVRLWGPGGRGVGRGGEGRRAWLGFLGSSRFQGRGGPEGRGGQGFVAWVDGWDGWWKRRPLLKKTTTTGRRKEKNKVVWCRIVIDDSRPGERSTSAGLEWLQCGVLRSERSVWRSSGAAAGPGAGAGGGSAGLGSAKLG